MENKKVQIGDFLKDGEDLVINMNEVEYLVNDESVRAVEDGEKIIPVVQLYDGEGYFFNIKEIEKSLAENGPVDYLSKVERAGNKLMTLVLVQQGSNVLLGMKKRDFGEGRWNGFGGKVLPGETIEAAAKREVGEEAGIDIEELEKVGILEFSFQKSAEMLEVHVFRAEKFEGEPIETDEMRPDWFNIEHIPFEDMWPDDKYWMPLFLAGKKFRGKFRFEESGAIIDQELTEVKKL